MGLLLFHSVWFGGKLVRSLDTVIRFHLILFGTDLLYSGTLLSDYSPIQSCLPAKAKCIRSRFVSYRRRSIFRGLFQVVGATGRRSLAEGSLSLYRHGPNICQCHSSASTTAGRAPAPPRRLRPAILHPGGQCPASPPPPNKVLLFRLR